MQRCVGGTRHRNGGALGICRDVFGDRENVHTLFLGRERVCAGTIFREREGVWALYL